eukprot:TRINITY_DN27692_c0_g1_i1.p1 TRINITY_DN27692_c0_g1~~TRINITY_DN27692_c0_g1_i1.p1  ORF type:complete len:138 (+),score=11.35 TRINITY_DN27692_c0_g1_i1:29-442(+)
MSKFGLSVCLFVFFFSLTNGVFWGHVGNNFGAFQRWKHRFVFGAGNRRQDSGISNISGINTKPSGAQPGNSQCRVDADCRGLRRCSLGVCSFTKSCDRDRDCKGSEACIDDECVRRRCSRDSQCSDGKKCKEYSCNF